VKHLLSIDDLSDEQILNLQERARAFRSHIETPERAGPNIGLLFLSSSLRTRLGFSVASQKIGANAIHVNEVRYSPDMSDGESFGDTLRTASGMLEAIVVRTPFTLSRSIVEDSARCPVINAGDGRNEHPTQALIDLYAMTELRGPIEELHIAIIGDATMRSVKSLVTLLGRVCPAKLTIISPIERSWNGSTISEPLDNRTSFTSEIDLTTVDVVYMAGLPPGVGDESLSAEQRSPFSLSDSAMSVLPSTSIVISPLPIVDEITDEVRCDSRIKMFEESDISVSMRMAVLEYALATR
jgi:aspartate carbamoyltransferase catalytic subunit